MQEIPCGVDQEAHGGRPPSGGGRRSLAKNTTRRRSRGRRRPASDRRRPTIPVKKYHAGETEASGDLGLYNIKLGSPSGLRPPAPRGELRVKILSRSSPRVPARATNCRSLLSGNGICRARARRPSCLPWRSVRPPPLAGRGRGARRARLGAGPESRLGETQDYHVQLGRQPAVLLELIHARGPEPRSSEQLGKSNRQAWTSPCLSQTGASRT